MLVAIYNNNRICSLDTKNIYGKYEYDTVETLKKAGHNNELLCEECGGQVILKAGDVKVPHFAHKHLVRDCYFNNVAIRESEEHKKGKLALYTFFKTKLPDAKIDVDFKLEKNRRANIHIKILDATYIFEYLRDDINLGMWEKKHTDYKELGITDFWILSAKDFRKNYKRSKYFFEKIIEKYATDNTIKLYDTDTNELVFLKYMEYRDKDGNLYKSKPFIKKYKLNELNISSDTGIFICDFLSQYETAFRNFCKEIQIEVDKKEREENNVSITKKTANKSEIEYKPYKEADTNNDKIRRASNNKTYTELKEEALKCKSNNPEGPWYDSTERERWGICTECGEFTNDWVQFSGKTNTCTCNKCKWN